MSLSAAVVHDRDSHNASLCRVTRSAGSDHRWCALKAISTGAKGSKAPRWR